MAAEPKFGPQVHPDGGVTFRLWAPAAQSVRLTGSVSLPLVPAEDGWFKAYVREAGAGYRYGFRIDDEIDVPDPASAFQPDDVFGMSEVISHDHPWRSTGWKGRPWSETVLLELHVGTFTPEGTYRAIIDRLDHLVETGITAIELMPLADFAGERNWGYDGVLLFAPDAHYGRPDDLRALIDAAHERGLMVFLDVVYNHFGPEGNFLGRYAPEFFTDEHPTPWGAGIDYRVPQVRSFAVENALHWLRHYRFDGLRLDAVHAIPAVGEKSILADISEAAGAFAAETGRHIHLVLENDDNLAAWLDPSVTPHQGKYRAQWNDDYHHAWHVVTTWETRGYYVDFAREPRRRIARALTEGFVYQGEASTHRKGDARGEPSAHLPPTAFVNFIQNHDQIGNRAFGERLVALARADAVEAALAVTLLAPSPPMLFMGEEWGATQPFPFFCDFDGDLGEAVRRGRKAEFAGQFDGLPAGRTLPDPLDIETFRSAVLDWSAPERPPHAARLRLVRDLLAARHRFVTPLIEAIDGNSSRADLDRTVLRVSWRSRDGVLLVLLANLADETAPAFRAPAAAEPVWGGQPADHLAPWAVHWWLERG